MVGELTYFLGFQVKQLKDGIFLSQSKYARELVKKFGLESTKHFRTPMPTNLKLSKDESKKVCARYQAYPKESHLIALKLIIRYIVGTLELGLWYLFDTHSMLIRLDWKLPSTSPRTPLFTLEQNTLTLDITSFVT
ncbi:hypothetical protein AAG906_021203 [Vitis piasezkii]